MILLLALLAPVAGTSPAAAGCTASLVRAADRHGVPPDLMLALGHAESAWSAYAVNSAGTSHFPETAAAAIDLVRGEQARGIDSIDVGCGQINLRWHRDAFADLAAAFDPERNADYAARFLADLYAAHGDWPTAVARYHSGDPAAQRTYLERVRERLVTLRDGAPPSYFPARTAEGQGRRAVAAEEGGRQAASEEPDAHAIRPRIVGVGPVVPGDAGGRVIQVPGTAVAP